MGMMHVTGLAVRRQVGRHHPRDRAAHLGLGAGRGHRRDHRPLDLDERVLGLRPQRLKGSVGGSGAEREDGQVAARQEVGCAAQRPGEHELLGGDRVGDHGAVEVEACREGDVGVARWGVLNATVPDDVEQVGAPAPLGERVPPRPEGEDVLAPYPPVCHLASS